MKRENQMIRRIAKGLLACAFTLASGLPALAQEDSTKTKKKEVEIEIKNDELSVEADDLENFSNLNEFIREVTRRAMVLQKQHREMMENIDEREEKGEISEEKADKLREAATERMEESVEALEEMMESGTEEQWETWAESYEQSMEAWSEQMEAMPDSAGPVMAPIPPIPPLPPFSMGKEEMIDSAMAESGKGKKFIISTDGIEVIEGESDDDTFSLRFKEKPQQDPKKEEEEESEPDATQSYFDFNIGFAQNLAGGTDFITDGPQEQNFWRSNIVDIGFGNKTRIGKPNSVLYIKYGLEVSWLDFVLTNDNALAFDADGNTVFRDDPNRNMERSKYKIAYFNIPVMLQLDFTKNVHDMDESFTMGVGGYGGIRMSAKRKLEYNDDNFDEIEQVARGDLNTNLLRYGVMGQVGWKNFKVTGRYDLNGFFQDGKGPDYQVASIAIGWTWQ